MPMHPRGQETAHEWSSMAEPGTAWIHSAIRGPAREGCSHTPRVVSCRPSKRATPRNWPLHQPALDRFRLVARRGRRGIQGLVDRGVRHQRAATTAAPKLAPPTLVSASLSALVAISRSRLLVWWWLAHGEVEAQLVGAAIGQVHPLAAVWAHQVGRSRTAAKGLDDLLLLGRHLFTLPQLCSISTRCAGWPSTISQTMWGAMPLGMSAGRSPRRSHRILVLQPRSCSWRAISPRTSLGGSSSSRRSSARLARASARSIRWFCTRFSRSCARRRGPAIAPGFCSPWVAAVPRDCLRLLADLDPGSIDHALQVGLQPPALPGEPPAPCRAAPAPRGSGISAGQLLPILGVSRVAGCGNRLAAKLAFTQPVPGPGPLQPEPRPAQRSGPAAQRRSPARTAVSSRADIDDLPVVGLPGWSVVTAGALGRARVADWLV
jgi:hypothetical protein